MKKQTTAHVMTDYAKMKRIARHYYEQGNAELALRTVFYAGGFMYTMNQIQYDMELEDLICAIAARNLPSLHCRTAAENIVVYYDGFGQVERGLTPIYLKALIHLGYEVKYITFDCNRQIDDRISAITGGKNIFRIPDRPYLEQMLYLTKVLENSGASMAFLYLHPDDVVAVGGFSHCPPGMKRYFINLTDHAFWLGKSICDIALNFREFGCKVCLTKRDFIPARTAYLPYYPVRTDTKFPGLPFRNNQNKLIVSGGALYKTCSKDNGYYKLVDALLSTCKNVNFLYLGNGDSGKIRKLGKKYPGRFIFSKERNDFFELLKRCTLYLSTYPYNGGLMTQYALLAGKIPITLSHPEIEQELSIRHEETFWNFSSPEECLLEIQRLLTDDAYRKGKEKQLGNFLINEEQFNQELQYILSHGCSKRKLSERGISFEGFRQLPLENLTGFKYWRLFFRKDGLYMAKYFPAKYTLGMIAAFYQKVRIREV